jgi:hypothetical protein
MGLNNGAAQQGVEADEAWSTSGLRSLTPVFDRPWRGDRTIGSIDCDPLLSDG